MVDSSPAPTPSAWVVRFLPLLRDGGETLDLACGSGRHTVLLAEAGLSVTAVDRDISGLPDRAGIRPVEADLEDGSPWPLADRRFDAIVVVNYLHRPLLPILTESLAPGGMLIYETFAAGNEKLGRPRNPDFLLKDGELLTAFAPRLTVLAYEAGRIERPAPAIVQRIAAVMPPAGPRPIPPPV